MKFFLGVLFGIIVASTYSSWAECCGAFNVPFDTQIEIERQQAWADSQRPFTMPAPTSPYRDDPCERRR